MAKNLIIFDIDGTLSNTSEVEGRCYLESLNHIFRFDDDRHDWENLKNVTDWGIAEEILERKTGRLHSKEEIEIMIPDFIRRLNAERNRDASQFLEIPGANDFYHHVLKQDEFVLGIATGSWDESGRIKLDSIGIDPDQVYYSNSSLAKSREGITQVVIDQAANEHGAFDRIVYFGDGVWDFKTCNNLGIEFIGIDVEDNGKLKKLGAEIVYRDYLDPNPILEFLG